MSDLEKDTVSGRRYFSLTLSRVFRHPNTEEHDLTTEISDVRWGTRLQVARLTQITTSYRLLLHASQYSLRQLALLRAVACLVSWSPL